MAQVVLAQELPDVLDRIEFRTVGRQMQQTDVFRHLQLVPRLVPAGAIEHQKRAVSLCKDTKLKAQLAATLKLYEGAR